MVYTNRKISVDLHCFSKLEPYENSKLIRVNVMQLLPLDSISAVRFQNENVEYYLHVEKDITKDGIKYMYSYDKFH